ncbi:hypothetical protein AOCH_004444 [Aspergillus ochraceoroseus]|uniref:CWH43-like N-terminal domain-containing protein n=1 Tax=Aspergillus ochraceoroseus TaxID=138278 RepID=A0A0F8WCC9_9EURO|nr:hypothetical protein AOCH_004444 [Aspergillus ochraceoroseus]
MRVDLTVPRFISDIASFELKPLFLVGASITAMGFLFTVAAVHVMRYEPGFALIRGPEYSTGTQQCEQTPDITDEEDNPLPSSARAEPEPEPEPEPDRGREREHESASDSEPNEREDHDTTKTLKMISLFSILAAGVAGASLILLSVMDTFRYKSAHHIFLRLCFAGLALQSAGTAIVYADEVLAVVSYLSHFGKVRYHWGGGTRKSRVRVFATLSTTLILIELFLAVAFISLTMDGKITEYRTAGILEWVIAFLGTVYLWLFGGFFDR